VAVVTFAEAPRRREVIAPAIAPRGRAGC